MTKSIYNLRHPVANSYIITKFDHELNVESSYSVSLSACDCPQGQRSKTCRHQRMLPLFLALARQDTEYFLDFDTKTWHRPLALEYEIEYHDLEVRKHQALEHDREILEAADGLEVIPKADSDSPPIGPATSTVTELPNVEVAPFTKADASTPSPSVSLAAPTEPEVPCVSVGAVPIKRRRI